jgi:hypothetical protein
MFCASVVLLAKLVPRTVYVISEAAVGIVAKVETLGRECAHSVVESFRNSIARCTEESFEVKTAKTKPSSFWSYSFSHFKLKRCFCVAKNDYTCNQSQSVKDNRATLDQIRNAPVEMFIGLLVCAATVYSATKIGLRLGRLNSQIKYLNFLQKSLKLSTKIVPFC